MDAFLSWAFRNKGALSIVALCVLVPIVLINAAVRTFGDTQVSLFSPRYLGNKVTALSWYASHRVRCVFRKHPPMEPLIADAERRHKVPRGLLTAVVSAESDYRSHRISWAGAMGPAQLMPSTAKFLRVDDPFDPGQAVDASARYLAAQLRRYRGSVPLAVAAYNAGPGAVKTQVPNNGQTEHYVRRVMAEYRVLRPKPPAPKPVIVQKAKSKRSARNKDVATAPKSVASSSARVPMPPVVAPDPVLSPSTRGEHRAGRRETHR